jgi:hypothetical protein
LTREKAEDHKYETPARENEEKGDHMKKMDSRLNQIE